jgi:hypothetical protein
MIEDDIDHDAADKLQRKLFKASTKEDIGTLATIEALARVVGFYFNCIPDSLQEKVVREFAVSVRAEMAILEQEALS